MCVCVSVCEYISTTSKRERVSERAKTQNAKHILKFEIIFARRGFFLTFLHACKHEFINLEIFLHFFFFFFFLSKTKMLSDFLNFILGYFIKLKINLK